MGHVGISNFLLPWVFFSIKVVKKSNKDNRKNETSKKKNKNNALVGNDAVNKSPVCLLSLAGSLRSFRAVSLPCLVSLRRFEGSF